MEGQKTAQQKAPEALRAPSDFYWPVCVHTSHKHSAMEVALQQRMVQKAHITITPLTLALLLVLLNHMSQY